MYTFRGFAVAFALLALAGSARADMGSRLSLARLLYPIPNLDQLNSQLHGKVIDFTHNHGADKRFWSEALCEKRDMYVYVPPCYDPRQPYPLIILFHGFLQDEVPILQFASVLDEAIYKGEMPPVIVAVPDGSIRGQPSFLYAGSFYVNSKAGRFEDYIMQDVWSFLHRRFCIRPEREAHVLAGGSMGGFGAYNLAIKYRDRIGVVVGLLPPLNLRYMNCHHRYFSQFDPNCFGWQEHFRPLKPVARYYHVIPVRERRLTVPLYGHFTDQMAEVSRQNPVEMLFSYDVQPGELEMFIGYVGHDEFNIGAQVESFLYFARMRCLEVTVVFHPEGHHKMSSAISFKPELIDWIRPRLAPYAPGWCCTPSQLPDSTPISPAPVADASNQVATPLCWTPTTVSPAASSKSLRQWLRHHLSLK
ncbi:MAG TPA: alpha/beta hydrolase-fold protein [Gemmataceae bacterium]|nr:alpha/beta hydrolase-fold protein [Gemmataceae bacterium]